MAIVKYDQENRPSQFGVKWAQDGKRKFKFFKTKTARNDFYTDLVRKQKNIGRALLDISSDEAVCIKKCVEILGDTSLILQACKEFSEKNSVKTILMTDAIKLFLDEKTKLGRDENYIRAVKVILWRVHTDLGDDQHNWNYEKARKWALSLNKCFKPMTVKNNIKNSNLFCRWCVEHNYLKVNPLKNVPIPEIFRPEVQFLKVAELKKLLETAKEHYPETIAYFALGAFAGIRSSACVRVAFKDINFKEKGILITAENAKNNQRSYLDGHEANLWTWLNYAKKNAPNGFNLTKRQWDGLRAKVAKLAKIKMPHNALRHSFCTYHVALHGDAGKTATLLTHKGNVSILYDHYKGNTNKATAGEYFNILP